MLPKPKIPPGPRAVNAVLKALGPLTPFGRRLSAEGLEQEAQRKTGLHDFGDAGYREGLVRLVDSLNEEARLSPIGRLIAREEILTALTNRLQLVEHHKARAVHECAEQLDRLRHAFGKLTNLAVCGVRQAMAFKQFRAALAPFLERKPAQCSRAGPMPVPKISGPLQSPCSGIGSSRISTRKPKASSRTISSSA